jgi:hypothetical protein
VVSLEVSVGNCAGIKIHSDVTLSQLKPKEKATSHRLNLILPHLVNLKFPYNVCAKRKGQPYGFEHRHLSKEVDKFPT